MGDGDAGIGQAAKAGTDARHDAKRNLGRHECERFFAAAAEQERIAALQTHDPFAAACQFDQAQRNVALFGARLAAPLAGVFDFGSRTRELKDRFIDKRVVDNDLRLLKRVQRVKRQQTRIARSCAHEPNPAGFQRRQIAAERTAFQAKGKDEE